MFSTYAASSCSASDVESCFSVASCSTTPSSVGAPSPRPAARGLRTLSSPNPALKQDTIHIPFRLPPPPPTCSRVDVDSLTLDEDVRDIPLDFVISKLHGMGPILLHTATSTKLHLPQGSDLPVHLRCSPPSTSTLAPSHILAITSNDSPRQLLVPVHGLSWALRSASLHILSSDPSSQPAHRHLTSTPPPPSDGNDVYLPVVSLTLPSSAVVPLLQSWVYLASPSQLLSSLLPRLVVPPASLSNLLNPTPDQLSDSYSHLPAAELLERIKTIHALWQDAVALEILDEGLWSTMSRAWSLLVAALAKKEERRKRQVLSVAIANTLASGVEFDGDDEGESTEVGSDEEEGDSDMESD